MPKSPGRKPDPTRAQTGEGWRPQPQPPGEIIDWSPPEGMSDIAREVWVRVVDHLADTGAVIEADKWMLSEMCELMGLALQYRIALQKEDDLTSAEAKRARVGYLDMLNMVDKIAAQYGLNPAARAKLGIGRKGAESGFLAFVRQTGILEEGDGDE